MKIQVSIKNKFIAFLSFFAIINSESDVKIQFFGAKQDGNRIRDAFQKLMERGRIGNITLLPSSLSFRDEAALQIEVC